MLNSYNKYKLQNDTSEEVSRIIYNTGQSHQENESDNE